MKDLENRIDHRVRRSYTSKKVDAFRKCPVTAGHFFVPLGSYTLAIIFWLEGDVS